MMKHIKSYDQYLAESKQAKDIEDTINKMGEPENDEDQLADDMADAKEGPTTPPEELDAKAENAAKKKKEAALAKKMKDSSQGEEEIEIEVEESAKNEDHGEMGDEIANMTISKMLDTLEKKDPDAYKDMEAYIKKNFSKAAKEGNFFTTMTA